MRRYVAAVLIAICVLASSLLVAVIAQGYGSEDGGFPDRTFIITKGKGTKPSYTAVIQPSISCTWWVQLTTLGGSAVKVDVREYDGQSTTDLSLTMLEDVGDESEHVQLVGGYEYRATFTYLGRPGISTLKERVGPVEVDRHRPILITSDDEFTGRNGVVSGSGTMTDPYVIKGWKIASSSGSCIEIRNTSAYFEIRGVSLAPRFGYVHGLTLLGVSNGAVLNSEITSGWNGIQMDYCTDIRIVGCELSDQSTGVKVSYCSNFELRDCKVRGDQMGLYLYFCTVFKIVNCHVMTGFDLCVLSNSNQGVLVGNTMTLLEVGGIGVYLSDSMNIAMYSNTLVNTSIDIGAFFPQFYDTHTIPTNNTVNGRPLLYQLGANDLFLDGADYGQVILVRCQNVLVSNMTFSRNDAAVIVAYSSQVVVRDNTFSWCVIGVRIRGCADIHVLNNSVTQAVFQAMGIWSTSNGIVDGNHMSGMGARFEFQTLMPIYHSSYLKVTNNSLSNCEEGLIMFSSSDSVLSGNIISNMTDFGMKLWLSEDVVVKENTFTLNQPGLSVDTCTRALIYHNNFVDNTGQALDVAPVDNHWDNGYPDGGNYWSDYLGSDSDGDGIGDTPYYVLESQDRYPLMEPYTPEPSEYAPHAPILIVGDSGFTYENGVVSGSGIASDPYVISGWDINASSATGLEIRGTTAYYVLRHLKIHSGTAVQPYLHEGIRLENAGNGRVEHVETYDNTIDLDIRYSSNIVIMNNDFTNDFSGTVYLTSCSSIEFYNNIFVTSGGGIVVQHSSYVTAMGNRFNAQGFGFWGSSASHFDTHVISPDNTVAGEPVIYIAHGQDIALDGVQAAQVIAASSTRVRISGLDLSHVEQGIVLAYVTDSVVESCTFTSDSYNCAKLYYCDNVTMARNLISGGFYYAIETISSSRLIIKDNIVSNCSHSYGIVIRFNSSESLIENNTAYGNYVAVLLYQAYGGVRVLNNNLFSNDIGIFMSGARGSEVAGNTIAMNAHEGILLESGSMSNVFHHNNMMSNAAQVVGETAGANTWDDGYPSGGNYWSDYQGVDEYSGSGQTEPGPDGIGDTPYVVSSGSQDRYPLMEPWAPQPSEFVPHEPIVIVGDAAFTLENGVVGGTGTLEDPFLIQGWMIDAHNSSDGILVSKTTAYFVINNVLVYNAGESRAGVTVSNAKHGQVENVVARECYIGIAVMSSEDIIVRDCLSYSNVYHGILVADSIRTDVRNNTMKDQMIGVFINGQGVNGTICANTIYNCEMGVYAEFVSAVAITGNSISSCSAAVILGEASDCAVSDNVIASCVGPMGAIYLRYDSNCSVDGNHIELTEQNGICILDSESITLTGNTVVRGGSGMFLIGFSGSGTDILVTGNVVRDNINGLQIYDLGSALIYGNDFVNNTYQAYQGNSSVTWDYLGSGNYWSDYTGSDLNGDGIGDSPYQVPGGGVDNHPLMAPCTA